ncbi:hypothetical protein JS532_00450 [Bifidobacterium callimiconis]|uniref:hypothetical protein n=1 Tax=Bifidobacterium callimiconis TaxID=2306973 RepID=UPI001BDD33E4|nr:hypothetical protein [Bifidobacterium callimiconis]MBT1176042.1 hypothetical protein [Bifidobacterium callimiconis]
MMHVPSLLSRYTVRHTAGRWIASLCVAGLCLGVSGCSLTQTDANGTSTSSASATATARVADTERKTTIESQLNLKNNADQEWTYDANADAWVLSVVQAVVNAELPDKQGVSVAVPGAYVTGIDTNGDGTADVTAQTASDAVKGSLVIDRKATITSTNGQTYTASTAPIIFTTGAAGYSEQSNQKASTQYASDGYIAMASGNRGKQSSVTDDSGNVTYTGDAPLCLVDQKAAARYVKYNIMLGNLPGDADRLVTTGGSGGGAHAAMFAATGNNENYYDYLAEAGAVGVYKTTDGKWTSSVTIDNKQKTISDGVWGTIAYSAITPLAEADMALAFEYRLDPDHSYSSDFQAKMAEYLAESYMKYINDKNLSVSESAVGFDLNNDGDTNDTVKLTIKHDDKAKHSATNGYYGTYLNLYLAEFEQNLQWYVDNLDYADGWTWFDSDGNAMSDEAVAAMTSKDRATAFLEGRYAKATTSAEGPGGGASDGTPPSGSAPSGSASSGSAPSGEAPSGEAPSGSAPNGTASTDGSGEKAGTPDAGTTQSSTGSQDSANYDSYDAMLSAYESDIASIQKGDKYGNNIVELYDPLNVIGADTTDEPTWTRVVMGASEGDMSLFSSLNMQIAWLNAGVDSTIEWQWDGGHVPSETLGDSLALYVDEMVGKYDSSAKKISKPSASPATTNGTATTASGTDISDWVTTKDDTDQASSLKVSFSLASAAAYRAKGASKAVPGFDVIDYGQEDYEFGSSTQDARHWDKYVLKVLQKHKDELSGLFNQNG